MHLNALPHHLCIHSNIKEVGLCKEYGPEDVQHCSVLFRVPESCIARVVIRISIISKDLRHLTLITSVSASWVSPAGNVAPKACVISMGM